jgi:hypothetical protein
MMISPPAMRPANSSAWRHRAVDPGSKSIHAPASRGAAFQLRPRPAHALQYCGPGHKRALPEFDPRQERRLHVVVSGANVAQQRCRLLAIPALAAGVIDGSALQNAMTMNKEFMRFLQREGSGTSTS